MPNCGTPLENPFMGSPAVSCGLRKVKAPQPAWSTLKPVFSLLPDKLTAVSLERSVHFTSLSLKPILTLKCANACSYIGRFPAKSPLLTLVKLLSKYGFICLEYHLPVRSKRLIKLSGSQGVV